MYVGLQAAVCSPCLTRAWSTAAILLQKTIQLMHYICLPCTAWYTHCYISVLSNASPSTLDLRCSVLLSTCSVFRTIGTRTEPIARPCGEVQLLQQLYLQNKLHGCSDATSNIQLEKAPVLSYNAVYCGSWGRGGSLVNPSDGFNLLQTLNHQK